MKNYLLRFLYLSVFALLVATSSVSLAQSYQGGLRGIISDAQGGVVSGVEVKLTDTASKLVRNSVTNGSGEYVFTAVEPSSYIVAVMKPGFKNYEQKGIVVGAQQFLTIDVSLSVGGSSETVEVTSSLPLIDATTASNGQEIDTQKLENLPNLGRNPFLFAKLSTNVAAVGDPRFNRFQDQSGSSQISIAGGPVRTNNYLVDGIPITDLNNRAVIIPSLEAVQEVKLQANTYDAEIARTGGGVFNTVLKGGSSALHGTLYGETRQTNWAAHPYFYTLGSPYSATFYSYAGAIGGPVIIPKLYNGKTKTHFWITEEGYRQRSPLSAKYYVPTTAERSGNFSASYGPGSPDGTNGCPAPVAPSTTPPPCLVDPLFGTPAGLANGSTKYFVGNIIPANRINPIGQALINAYPVVDTAAIPTGLAYLGAKTGEVFNTSGTDLLGDRADEFVGKVDHQVFKWWYANFSYMHYGSKEPGGDPLHSFAGDQSPQASYLLYRKVDAISQNNTFTVTPTTIATVGYGFNRFPNNTLDLSNGYDITQLGFSPAFASSLAKKAFPAVVPLNAATNGTNDSGPAVYYSRSILASIAKSLGKHSLKAGYDFRSISVDFTDVSSANGQLYFDNSYTTYDLANLLLGYPTTNSTNSTFYTVPSKLFFNVRYNAGYVQDSWRILNNLTLNYGVRYEYEPGLYERKNQLVVGFNRTVANPTATYPNAVGGVEFAGTNGYPTNCCNYSNHKIAPRAGFAYQPKEGTVLRGGFGIFFPPPYISGSSSLAPGYLATTTFNYTTPASAAGTSAPLSNLATPTQPSGNSLGYATGNGGSITEIDQSRRYGIVQQYSADVQQQLPFNMVFKLGYVGAHGKNLQPSTTSGTTGYNINQVPDQYLNIYTAAQLTNTCANAGAAAPAQCAGIPSSTPLGRALRPFQNFNTVTALGSPASSNYNSMIVRLEKSTGFGLTFLSSFTWSSTWDSVFGTSSTINSGNTAAQDANNLKGEYARSIVSIPLRFSVGATYDLPWGKGRMYLNKSSWLDLIVGGWSINTVGVKQSGSPLAPSMNSNGNQILNAAVQRPSFAPGSNVYNAGYSGRTEGRLGAYFNKNAFVAPGTAVYGNVPRTLAILGPGLNTWDVSVFKTKKLKLVELQFRAEALNVFNTPQFGAPNVKILNSNAGVVASQVNLPRYIQLGGRINF